MSGRLAFSCLFARHSRTVYVSRLCFLILLAVGVSPALVARNSQASPSPTSTPRRSSTTTASLSPSPSPTPSPTRATKKIIHWQAGAGGHGTLPSHILANLAWIDSLPFDGLVFYNDASYTLLAPGNVANYSNLYNTWFAPIKGKLKNVTHNYQTVFCRRSADVFDDWTQVIANWTAMAQAARDGAFEGLLFDNECYYESVWNYPGDVKYGSTKTLN